MNNFIGNISVFFMIDNPCLWFPSYYNEKYPNMEIDFRYDSISVFQVNGNGLDIKAESFGLNIFCPFVTNKERRDSNLVSVENRDDKIQISLNMFESLNVIQKYYEPCEDTRLVLYVHLIKLRCASNFSHKKFPWNKKEILEYSCDREESFFELMSRKTASML